MKNPLYSLLVIFSIVLLPENIYCQETLVMIRAQSKDAKFIGTSIGGAKVIVKEENTGKILAEGITSGSTGDTQLIMKEPMERGKRLTGEKTAGYLAKLNIDQPVFVTIEVIAPINKKQASVKTSTQLWIIPGKDITGDGVILEVPGFVVDILVPQTHENIAKGKEIEISANIVMMCGCPITEGGIWDASKYEVNAIISSDGKDQKVLEMKITDKPSTFKGNVSLSPGNYEITVYAFDPITGNTGLDKTNVNVN
jgi:hypothetical protein